MKKVTKSVIAAAILAATSTTAMAEVSMNIGATSNYMWRGVTQSNDGAAVSGGMDYKHESGFYAGTWTSSIAGGDYELDLYAGFSGEAAGFGYDIGAISYQYPISESYFHEVYFNGSYNILTFGGAYTFGSDDDDTAEFSQGDVYAYVGLETEVSEGITVGLKAGSYAFSNSDNGLPAADPNYAESEDYTHLMLSVSKGDFTFAIDKNDKEDTGAGEDKPRVSVSWSQSF